jgi:UDP-N-acetylglucosamine--dolichyl-phosphate N-acetylglucosaminephosphotransferase
LQLIVARSPESLGIVCGIVFLAALICGELVFTRGQPEAYKDLSTALLCITFMLLLGFMDDVLELKWRYKLILPLVASLPLLVMYDGATTVVLPHFLRFFVAAPGGDLTVLGAVLQLVPGVGVDKHGQGALVELGPWYLVFVCLLAIFCTNAINIYAGINGLEAGQALVIACAMLGTNLLELTSGVDVDSPHLHSAMLMLPFIGVTLALMLFNICPAAVFVGDTFCYFAGMAIAVAGIQGHFSKTLLLFFAPQIINFLYSLPQLFKVVPCPRHRLPWVDEKSGLMLPSRYPIKLADGTTTERDNLTVLCLVLRITGPISEAALTRVLLVLQLVACAIGVWLRFYLSTYTRDIEAIAGQAGHGEL